MDPCVLSPPLPPLSFPRPRGDGPLSSHSPLSGRLFPPPTRGWTRHAVAQDPAGGVSPAHAGMDPRDVEALNGLSGFPRPRGDGPTGSGAHHRCVMFPPPTRGWTQGDSAGLDARQVSPAHAGMDPAGGPPSSAWLRFPRPRGDGPARSRAQTSDPSFPPPTRGWTLRGVTARECRRVSPAHAGMDPPRETLAIIASCFPRPRGDGPILGRRKSSAFTFPPPTRGWTSQCHPAVA